MQACTREVVKPVSPLLQHKRSADMLINSALSLSPPARVRLQNGVVGYGPVGPSRSPEVRPVASPRPRD